MLFVGVLSVVFCLALGARLGLTDRMKWTIRQEKSGDEAAIALATQLAFAGKTYADGDEAELPARLRDAGALVLSLVAVERKQIIGQACLSPATIGGEKWLGLGPVSVVPDKQGNGIGSALVSTAVSVAQAYGRGGVVLMGDPTFYTRLGFELAGAATFRGKPSPYLQAYPFGEMPTGDAIFHAAFGEGRS